MRRRTRHFGNWTCSSGVWAVSSAPGPSMRGFVPAAKKRFPSEWERKASSRSGSPESVDSLHYDAQDGLSPPGCSRGRQNRTDLQFQAGDEAVGGRQ